MCFVCLILSVNLFKRKKILFILFVFILSPIELIFWKMFLNVPLDDSRALWWCYCRHRFLKNNIKAYGLNYEWVREIVIFLNFTI